VGQCGRNHSEKLTKGKPSRKQHSPGWHNINAPDQNARDHPDNRDSNQYRLFEKEPNRKQKVSDVAHPQRVAQLIDMPIVDRLRSKKCQRENAEEAESSWS
jgi:hypothetical protein